MKAKYPECEKLKACHEELQAQGRFLDWLEEQGIHLASLDVDEEGGDQLFPVTRNREILLAEYHGIDLKKVEQERREIIESLR